jgi:hypothetical protein
MRAGVVVSGGLLREGRGEEKVGGSPVNSLRE